jgi:Tol biopolymer transport system component
MTHESPQPHKEQLNSWKDIAVYFGRDVTTVQRWEKREGMPVHRHLHDKIGSVYAFRSELDLWARSRNLRSSQEAAVNIVPPEPVAAPATDRPRPSKQRQALPRRALVFALPGLALAAFIAVHLHSTDYFWRNPIEGARFQPITDFDGVARDAALSRDGRLVAFLSDHDGQMDVWLSQIGSGQFHNLTHGNMAELVNPQVRTLGFSADSSMVTFWVRGGGVAKGGSISIWAVPTLGGEPKPYLEGAAEFDWSRDGSQLAWHSPGPGDPLFVSDGLNRSQTRSIFAAPAGLHAHFPLWSRDSRFIYFVQGSLPDQLDIWRIAAEGGAAERITSHAGYVSHPVLLDERTLMYLARDPDGSGPWLYGLDIARRKAYRLTPGPERYTSLSASADGRRVAVTVATPKTTLWRLRIADPPTEISSPVAISLTTSAGFFPRFGPDYLLYVSSTDGSDSIWKYGNGIGAELWRAPGARVLAAPAISADGRSIAFSVRQNGRSRLYVMQADGTNAHAVTDSLDLQGEPAWARDGRSITCAVNEKGVPHLFRISLAGGARVPFIKEYSVDPAWAPEGGFVMYSGADIGATFSIRAARYDGAAYRMPSVTLTRGTRHIAFAPGRRSVILLQGEIEHKDLWAIDFDTGARRRLSRLPGDFNVREFDLSRDGSEVVLERVQEHSDIVLVDRPQR